jgi:hypothetical protein
MAVTGSWTKGGEELAAALEEVAGNPGLMANPADAFEVLGIDIPSEYHAYAPLEPESLLRAAEAIRAGCIPAFWPWIWWIPWIAFRAPRSGESPEG